jgi:hypothetical protein
MPENIKPMHMIAFVGTVAELRNRIIPAIERRQRGERLTATQENTLSRYTARRKVAGK